VSRKKIKILLKKVLDNLKIKKYNKINLEKTIKSDIGKGACSPKAGSGLPDYTT